MIKNKLVSIFTLFMIFVSIFSSTGTVSVMVANDNITNNTNCISDLNVYDEKTSSKWSIEKNLQIGDVQFSDRSFLFGTIPETYIGCYWIKTASDTKNNSDEIIATFKVLQDSDIYVLHDDKIKSKPEWMKEWFDTGEDIINTEATPVTFSMYKRYFRKNSVVTIGNNGQVKNCSNYTILVRPYEVSTKDNKRINLTIGDPLMYVDGIEQEVDEGRGTTPLVHEGRTLLPIRAVVEAIGGSIEWNEDEEKVSIDVFETKIDLWINNKEIMVNGERKSNDVAPQIINERTFLPLRFIAENAGCVVGWDGDTKSIIITSGDTIDEGNEVTWSTSLNQNKIWYASDDAIKFANNILLEQRDDGGWFGNSDMTYDFNEDEKAILISEKGNHDSIIGNGSTTHQLMYLAKVYNETGLLKYKEAFKKGLNLLLSSQYDYGGWPQYLVNDELSGKYERYITYTDHAIVSVLYLLKDIDKNTYDYSFVDEITRIKCNNAYNKGIECILMTQVMVNNSKTAWSVQYDNITLEPAMISDVSNVKSVNAYESVAIIEFLMSIETPKQQIIEAIKSAVEWIDSAKIIGIKEYQRKGDDVENGSDLVIINDNSAPNIWARYYELGTNKPIFCDSDEVIKYSLAELDYDSRNSYSWYTYAPSGLIAKTYPDWFSKFGK